MDVVREQGICAKRHSASSGAFRVKPHQRGVLTRVRWLLRPRRPTEQQLGMHCNHSKQP